MSGSSGVSGMTAGTALCTALALFLAGCIESGPFPGNGDWEAVETRSLAQDPQSGHEVEDRRVIESPQEWGEFWQTHQEQRTSKSEPPEVDFDSERVIVAVMGMRPNGCYGIAITGVAVDDSRQETHVNVTSLVPAPDAICTQAIVSPVHAVAVPADGTHVVFHEYETDDPGSDGTG